MILKGIRGAKGHVARERGFYGGGGGIKKKVLEVDGGDDCTTRWMYLMSLNCTLKNHWNGNFYVIYMFTTVKNVYIQKYATRDSKALAKEKQSKECDPKTK